MKKIDKKMIVFEYFLVLMFEWAIEERDGVLKEIKNKTEDIAYNSRNMFKIFSFFEVKNEMKISQIQYYDYLTYFVLQVRIVIFSTLCLTLSWLIFTEVQLNLTSKNLLIPPMAYFQYLDFSKEENLLSIKSEYDNSSLKDLFFKEFPYLKECFEKVTSTFNHFKKCDWKFYSYSSQNLNNYITQSSAWLAYVGIKRYEGKKIMDKKIFIKRKNLFCI